MQWHHLFIIALKRKFKKNTVYFAPYHSSILFYACKLIVIINFYLFFYFSSFSSSLSRTSFNLDCRSVTLHFGIDFILFLIFLTLLVFCFLSPILDSSTLLFFYPFLSVTSSNQFLKFLFLNQTTKNENW